MQWQLVLGVHMHCRGRSWRGIPAVSVFFLLAQAAPARAEEEESPQIPLMEIGVLASVGHRPTHPTETGGDVDGASNGGAMMRIEVSVLGLLVLPFIVGSTKFRIGDYIGIDFGPSIPFGIVGQWVIGGQATYEINRNIGVGFRVYSKTVFDPLLPSHQNLIVADVSGRFRKIVGRVRFSVAQGSNAGSEANDLGLTLRFPTSWSIMGYQGWAIGLDYDRIAHDRGETGDEVLHRAQVAVVIGF